MTGAFDALAHEIKDLANGETVLLLTNRGNYGDSLIRVGAEEFLRFHQIPYRLLPRKKLEKGQTTLERECAIIRNKDPLLLLLTAGVLSGHYGGMDQLVTLTNSVSRSLFMPSTYSDKLDYSSLAKTSVFYARDKAESMQTIAHAKFCHDMAFFLELTPRRPGRGTGYFFRTDVERNDLIPLPAGNVDISRKGKTASNPARFISMIEKVEILHTNRLHVAIAGAILGREVHLYPNDYFKIRAMYDASLAPYYPNVFFHDPEDFQAPVSTSLVEPLMHLFRRRRS
ncbi:MAG: hypothetical protein RIB61_19390 [Roseicyclus sp.]